MIARRFYVLTTVLLAFIVCGATVATQTPTIGREMAVPRHLQDGEEFTLSTKALIEHGRTLFTAAWTIEDGGGRPLTKGTGNPLGDTTSPLLFPRNFNRISAPDANSCAGCHNLPFGIPGGGGDIVANVFVLGQRFDFATFDGSDTTPTRGEMNEIGQSSQLQNIANSRATLGMFGSGFIEMLARQITEELQAIRDITPPRGSRALVSKGISFGTIARAPDGGWITSGVQGIAAPSLATSGPKNPPSLVIRPFHQAGNVVSIRQFSNNAFNHHHGIQSTERFGIGTDPDGDGVVNEMTRADVTAVSIFQATMAVPGRVIPNDPDIEAAVLVGEQRFASIRCVTCHVPALPLDRQGWMFTEPNPFNPASPHNLLVGEAPSITVDLSRDDLPNPRLKPQRGVVMVPAYTDLKLHDITTGLPGDPNIEALDMNQPAGSPGFFAGNRRFLTRKLWGTANEPPFFHHGQYTTLRQAVLAHAGEALASRQAFEALSEYEQGSVIEFLKTLRVLPPGTKHLIVDEHGEKKRWPPRHDDN
ncbi:MAG: thiol oxidoreductase [Acidobacteria bacterium]|nr:MAG: thiol oxidoreductase [Acidobacteriota bacterium]PYQ81915.1 MAG: thiol oxidoreductase [Acidobacteriota bacterium]PYQ88632.1 MAG: thiol oxidoreductase [Acidobacteriota bacterium]